MRKPMFVLFDMDGVLLDTETAYLQCWKEVLKEMGAEVPNQKVEEVYHKVIGVKEDEMRRIVLESLKEYSVGEDFLTKAMARFLEKAKDGIPLKRGAEDILSFLKEKEVPMALVTSTHSEIAKPELDAAGLSQYFSCFVFGDMVEQSKPDPAIYRKAMAELSADPNATFVVEDSFNGVRAGHAAGARVIMVPDMVQPDALMRAMAFRVVKNMRGVHDVLEPMLRDE